jgi:Flp pilus assembly protein TadB
MGWVLKIKVIDLVIQLSSFSPAIGLESKLVDPLSTLKPGAEKKRYIGAALIISLFAMVSSSLFSVLIGETIFFGIFGFAISFALVLALPQLELRKRNAEFIARLPMDLQTLGMLIDMNIPFQDALTIVSKDEPEFREVVCEIKKGSSVQKALSRLILENNSFELKRAISALINSYEIGCKGSEIRAIADEMNSLSRHRLREYSSKSAIFGLLFIVSAAVLPTFFLVYSTLGGFSVGEAFGELEMIIALLIIFPLISFSILMIAKSMLPYSVFGESGKKQDLRIVVPTFVMLGFFLIVPSVFSIVGIVIGAGAASYIVYANYSSEKRIEEIERNLPDALFSISSMPKSAKIEDLFGVIERSGYGALSAEAKKSRMQISANLSTDIVLEDLSKRNDSGMLKKACQMLGYVFSTNSFEQMNKLATDMLNFVEVRRERSGLLSMQKYTLVFGGLIVPLILKITLDLLQSMAHFFEGDVVTQLSFAKTIIPAYIVIYALLSSIYIQNIEERRSKSAGYFLAIVVVGLATFFFLNI